MARGIRDKMWDSLRMYILAFTQNLKKKKIQIGFEESFKTIKLNYPLHVKPNLKKGRKKVTVESTGGER